MQDVEKTEIQRNTSAKRMRRRNRLRPLYFLVVAVLVAGVGIALSMTAFFNIATIEVGGNKPKQYNEDEIAHASGVHTGDNMMRLNKEEVAQNILDSLVFVEDVQVEKKFPDVLVITVSASHSAFNVVDDSGKQIRVHRPLDMPHALDDRAQTLVLPPEILRFPLAIGKIHAAHLPRLFSHYTTPAPKPRPAR